MFNLETMLKVLLPACIAQLYDLWPLLKDLCGCCGRHAPFMMPFEERAGVFQAVMAAQRTEHHASTRSQHPFGIEPVSFVTIRRDHLLEVCIHLFVMASTVPDQGPTTANSGCLET